LIFASSAAARGNEHRVTSVSVVASVMLSARGLALEGVCGAQFNTARSIRPVSPAKLANLSFAIPEENVFSGVV